MDGTISPTFLAAKGNLNYSQAVCLQTESRIGWGRLFRVQWNRFYLSTFIFSSPVPTRLISSVSHNSAQNTNSLSYGCTPLSCLSPSSYSTTACIEEVLSQELQAKTALSYSVMVDGEVRIFCNER